MSISSENAQKLFKRVKKPSDASDTPSTIFSEKSLYGCTTMWWMRYKTSKNSIGYSFSNGDIRKVFTIIRSNRRRMRIDSH